MYFYINSTSKGAVGFIEERTITKSICANMALGHLLAFGDGGGGGGLLKTHLSQVQIT